MKIFCFQLWHLFGIFCWEFSTSQNKLSSASARYEMSSQQPNALASSSSIRSSYRNCEIRSVSLGFLTLRNESAASIHLIVELFKGGRTDTGDGERSGRHNRRARATDDGIRLLDRKGISVVDSMPRGTTINAVRRRRSRGRKKSTTKRWDYWLVVRHSFTATPDHIPPRLTRDLLVSFVRDVVTHRTWHRWITVYNLSINWMSLWTDDDLLNDVRETVEKWFREVERNVYDERCTKTNPWASKTYLSQRRLCRGMMTCFDAQLVNCIEIYTFFCF